MDRFMINYRGDLRSHSAAGEIHDSEINWWRDRRISVELERRSRLAQGLPSMHPWENRRHVPCPARAFHSSSCWLLQQGCQTTHISYSPSKIFFSPPILDT
jgi:hypothetical protein